MYSLYMCIGLDTITTNSYDGVNGPTKVSKCETCCRRDFDECC